jgi:MoxR-like ATPase
LPRPFFLLATQNPIEQAGTNPLPEAQLDRFLLYIRIQYPSEQEELSILAGTTGASRAVVQPALSGADLVQLQQLVREVSISPDLIAYVNQLVRNTRPATSTVDFVREYVRWGAGPRAGQALILTAKARALLHHRFAVTAQDLQTLAYPVLRHRLVTGFNAEADEVDTDRVVRELLATIQLPKVAI